MTAIDELLWLLMAAGPAGVAALAFAEKFLPVLPSYALLVAVGLAAVDGPAGYGLAVAASVAGSVAGALVWYGIGRAVGEARVARLVARHGRWLLLSEATYARMAAGYVGAPFRTTLVGQVVPTVRIYLALPAGVLRLPVGPFALATALGTLAWNAPLIGLGYALRGSGLDPVPVAAGCVAAVAAAELAAALVVWRRRRRRTAAASEPTPRAVRRPSFRSRPHAAAAAHAPGPWPWPSKETQPPS